MKQGTAAYTAPSNASSGAVAGAAAAPGTKGGGGFSDYVVHGIIALVVGIVSFVVVLLVFARVLPENPGALPFVLMFLLGFCAPAAYAFHHSYKKSQEEQERKRFGLTRTSGFTDVAAGTSAKPYVPQTRMNVPTPHYERTKMEYLPANCALDDGRLQEWRELLGEVEDEDKLIPRNYLFTSLEGGDAQPGIIVHSDAELVIASLYSDEFDSYVFVGFTGGDRAKLEADGLASVGTRLVCAWKYAEFNPMEQTDIIRGKNGSNEFGSGEPSIIDLLSNDAKRLDYLKRMFGDKMYATVLDGSRQMLASGRVTRLRHGSPLIGSYLYMDYRPAAAATA